MKVICSECGLELCRVTGGSTGSGTDEEYPLLSVCQFCLHDLETYKKEQAAYMKLWQDLGDSGA